MAGLKRFAYIDALRGYAVLGVVLVHTGQYCGFVDGPAFGARGVQLFFVVSAFTLLHSWRARNDGILAFFIRRFFRIAPMFWLSIPIYLIFVGSQGLGTGQILAASLFLQATTPHAIAAPIVAGGWSIDVEVAFYCLFPLLAKRVKSLPGAAVFLLIAFVISELWLRRGFRLIAEYYSELPSSDVYTFVWLSLPVQLQAFAAGFVAFYSIPKIENASRMALEAAAILAMLAIGYLAINDVHNIFAFSLCFGMIVAAMGASAATYLVNPLIVLIGRCSFSIYLLHFIFVGYALKVANLFEGDITRFVALFFLTTATTAAIAFLSFKFVERPMISLGEKLLDRLKHRTPIEAGDRGAAGNSLA